MLVVRARAVAPSTAHAASGPQHPQVLLTVTNGHHRSHQLVPAVSKQAGLLRNNPRCNVCVALLCFFVGIRMHVGGAGGGRYYIPLQTWLDDFPDPEQHLVLQLEWVQDNPVEVGQ